MIQALRGMKDILPPESLKWERLNRLSEDIFSAFGYSLSITPILERTELFVRSVGSDSDVVSKEMYTFDDRGQESVTLRPEATASVMRAYLSSPIWKGKMLKTWYWGPMFRYERPQKGRYRQFYQFGLEAIGTSSPYIDAELIYMLDFFYKKIGLKNVSIELNSIGCSLCRPAYRKELSDFFTSKSGELCKDCNNRMSQNPLRILDCKQEACSGTISKAPTVKDYICNDCSKHHSELLSILDDLGLCYTVNPLLVRGLDYYTKTVFEFITEDLGGRQNALGGGGRYDSLSEQLGAKPVPSVGYAGGIERTVLLSREEEQGKDLRIYFAPMDEKAMRTYLPLVLELKKTLSDCGRTASFVDDDFKPRDIKKHLSRADKTGANYAIIVGEKELNESTLILKDLRKKEEDKFKVDLKNTSHCVKEILWRIIEK